MGRDVFSMKAEDLHTRNDQRVVLVREGEGAVGVGVEYSEAVGIVIYETVDGYGRTGVVEEAEERAGEEIRVALCLACVSALADNRGDFMASSIVQGARIK